MKKKKKKEVTSYQLYYTLKGIYDNDCYLQEFLDDDILEEFLTTLVDNDILYIASDDRVLFTTYGERFLQKLIFFVELSNTETKVYSNE